jgi:hypothetical protein
MSALTILLIRHAEKPGGKSPGPGLSVEGVPDNKSLVIQGWRRAGAWAAFFGATPLAGDYPRPTAIYAARPEGDGLANPSQRPYETIRAVGERLHIEPIVDFPKGEEERLAKHLMQLTGSELVSWEHKAIVETLIPALLGGQRIGEIPAKWDDDRFDVVLRFDRAAPGSPWSFRQMFPRLLAGDSDVPI